MGWSLIIALALGMIGGLLLQKTNKYKKIVALAQSGSLLLLLTFMGIKIGFNDEVINNLMSIGFRAFMLSLGAILGSVLLVHFITRGSRKVSS